MAIQATIEKQISEALRAHDEVRLRTLRSLFAAMTNEAIAKRAHKANEPLTLSETIEIKSNRFLTDEEALGVLKRAANQRKDSIHMFEEAGRADLAEPEKAELAIIESYLPAQMTREEIAAAAKAKMAELGVSSKADTGKFIGALMKELKDRADGGDVKAVVDSLLS